MRFRSMLAGGLLILLGALPLQAAETAFAEPILLTSCGQSADVLMVKALLTREGFSSSYVAGATGAVVAGKGSVILVLGGSSKGLGAAKISAEEETARVQNVIAAAQKAGVPILAVHLGGLNRRGALSDPFNTVGASAATRLVVVKGGNDDGFFTKIAEANKIPLETTEDARALGGTFKTLYGK